MRSGYRMDGRVCAIVTMMMWAGCASTLDLQAREMRAEVAHAAPLIEAAAKAPSPLANQPRLDRAALIRAVLERNPTLEAERQAWRAALARFPQVTAYPDPQLSYSLAPLSIGGQVPYGQAIELSQAVPFFGKLRMRGAIALARAEAAHQDYAARRLDLALLAARLYDRYFAIARSLAINAEHTALLQDLKQSALAEYAAGHGSQQDPLEAEVELVHIQHHAIVLAADRAVVAAELNALLHREPAAPLPPPPASLDAPPPSPTSAEDPSSHRPELRAVDAALHGDRAALALRHRDYFPDFTFRTSYNSMWAMPEHQWMVGVALNLPLSLGRRRAAVDEAEAGLAADRGKRAALTDDIHREVAVARVRLVESHHVVRLYRDRIVPLTRDEVAAARAGYVSAHNSFVAVIAAEKNLRDVELTLELARADEADQSAALDRALGQLPRSAHSTESSDGRR